MSKTYNTPQDLKRAIAQRLQPRERQLMIFDRLLARLNDGFCEPVVLKGGLALEYRLRGARTTKDVDVRVTGDPDELLARLQRAGRSELGDKMLFEVTPAKHANISGPGVRYEGRRFAVECRLAGKAYAKFGLDVGVGDPMIHDPDEQLATDWLEFAAIPPPLLRLYPIATHVAEKLHAYTMPRDATQPNSRVKDLPDIALLGRVARLKSSLLHQALAQTFDFRGTHAIPDALPAPPESWRRSYATLQRDFDLPWRTLDDCLRAARCLLNPVLAGERAATWDPESSTWLSSAPT
ncbi:MAG: nucleotidyl transferase AbiEii/AbiGii toxin family protein [Myxococcales bacterium]|nr:nucleotidyl transferase AbiEii/AbiGii toxin family protein [Myxococcales bacterium]